MVGHLFKHFKSWKLLRLHPCLFKVVKRLVAEREERLRKKGELMGEGMKNKGRGHSSRVTNGKFVLDDAFVFGLLGAYPCISLGMESQFCHFFHPSTTNEKRYGL